MGEALGRDVVGDMVGDDEGEALGADKTGDIVGAADG